MAGEQPPPLEWLSLEPDNRRRPGSPQEHGMGRLLAQEGSMTDQSNDHAVSRLISKRAEMAGMIARLEQEVDQCRADLTHIDGALRVLSADLDPETIPPRRRYERARYFAHNELSRLCMDSLRMAANEPLTAEEITIRTMNAKGLEAGDARLRATIRVQIAVVLKRLHRRQVAAPSGKGVGAMWRLLAELG